jgi:hypothetical protein
LVKTMEKRFDQHEAEQVLREAVRLQQEHEAGIPQQVLSRARRNWTSAQSSCEKPSDAWSRSARGVPAYDAISCSHSPLR